VIDSEFESDSEAATDLDSEPVSDSDSERVSNLDPEFVPDCEATDELGSTAPFSDEVPLTTQVWRRLTGSDFLTSQLSEFIKLAEWGLVMSPGSVEDERVFSSMKFLKDSLRNKLSTHLALCMRLYRSHHTAESFPYTQAIAEWRKRKNRYTGKK